MEINSGKLANVPSSFNITKVSNGAVNTDSKTETKSGSVQEEQKVPNNQEKELSNETVTKMTGDLNKLMQVLNADLQFALHEKTNRIMVQLVNTKEDKVLREFPPHELLDTIAKIKDYIGLLLDKKA